MKKLFGVLVIVAVVATGGMIQAKESALTSMVVPVYDGDKNLIRPEGYRDWVFVGASLGLSYFEPRTEKAKEKEEKDDPGLFHHVYIQREAYDHYGKTGKFPEKTILVMENYSAGGKEGINLKGHFEKDLKGMEVALKDHDTFEEGWAYFNFSTAKGPLKEKAKAFPKAVCYNCHVEHAADDNVFVQFYPILRELKPSLGVKPDNTQNR